MHTHEDGASKARGGGRFQDFGGARFYEFVRGRRGDGAGSAPAARNSERDGDGGVGVGMGVGGDASRCEYTSTGGMIDDDVGAYRCTSEGDDEEMMDETREGSQHPRGEVDGEFLGTRDSHSAEVSKMFFSKVTGRLPGVSYMSTTCTFR